MDRPQHMGALFMINGGMMTFAGVLVLAISLVLSPSAAYAQAETVCIECHSSLERRAGAPFKQWQASIHAESGISCHNCHGGDPKDPPNAMSPARGFLGVPKETDIPAFCGQCHVGIKVEFLASAHGKALGRGGPTCVTCHGSHGIKRVTIDIINEKTCSQCHSYERAAEIKEAMRLTERHITDIGARLGKLKVKAIETETQEKKLFSERNRYHRLFHDVDTGRVKAESAGINKELEKIDSWLAGFDYIFHMRKIAGAIAVGAALLAALLFHLLMKTYKP